MWNIFYFMLETTRTLSMFVFIFKCTSSSIPIIADTSDTTSATQSPTATMYTVHIHNHVHALIPISLFMPLLPLFKPIHT